MTRIPAELFGSFKSAINPRHELFVVARSGHGLGAHRGLQARHIVVVEFDIHGTDVLLEVRATLCARDRHNEVTLAQKPCERDLAWLHTDGSGDIAHDRNRLHVSVKVFPMETRIVLAAGCCAGSLPAT